MIFQLLKYRTFNDWALRLSTFLWLALFTYMGYFAVENFYTTPFEISDRQVLSETSHVHPGEILKITYTSHETQSCYVSFIRYIRGGVINNHEIIIQPGFFQTAPGNTMSVPVNVEVPAATVPGTYSIYTRYRYQCNIMDYIFVREQSIEVVSFVVVAGRPAIKFAPPKGAIIKRKRIKI